MKIDGIKDRCLEAPMFLPTPLSLSSAIPIDSEETANEKTLDLEATKTLPILADANEFRGTPEITKVEKALEAAVVPAPLSVRKGFAVEFETTDEKDPVVTVTFVRSPLGLKFARRKPTGEERTPIYVSSLTPAGHAESLGVQLNWTISKVSGQSTSDLSFEVIKDIFKMEAEALRSTHFKMEAEDIFWKVNISKPL